MTSAKCKFIFVHVTKTGGTSIQRALNIRTDHVPASKIREKVGKNKWSSYFKFSFVRNPFDKIVSQSHYNGSDFGFKNSTFKQYVKAWSEGHRISWYPPFNLFYIDEKLDFIGRFENLQEDFDIVCDKIGIARQQLPRANKSEHKHYTEYYDEETKQIVAEKHAKDIEYFGYKFGE